MKHNIWHLYGTNNCSKILYFLVERLKEVNPKSYKKCKRYVGSTISSFCEGNTEIEKLESSSLQKRIALLWLNDFKEKSKVMDRYDPNITKSLNSVLTAFYRNSFIRKIPTEVDSSNYDIPQWLKDTKPRIGAK